MPAASRKGRRRADRRRCSSGVRARPSHSGCRSRSHFSAEKKFVRPSNGLHEKYSLLLFQALQL
jgi:hypothetical protein